MGLPCCDATGFCRTVTTKRSRAPDSWNRQPPGAAIPSLQNLGMGNARFCRGEAVRRGTVWCEVQYIARAIVPITSHKANPLSKNGHLSSFHTAPLAMTHVKRTLRPLYLLSAHPACSAHSARSAHTFAWGRNIEGQCGVAAGA